jgi:hypothetical protein
VIWIWPINKKVIYERTKPEDVYIIGPTKYKMKTMRTQMMHMMIRNGGEKMELL